MQWFIHRSILLEKELKIRYFPVYFRFTIFQTSNILLSFMKIWIIVYEFENNFELNTK